MSAQNAQKLKRPPVVVVMGHVDHGKTTLLDVIRKANVAGKEAGGITQAVGAYEITHNKEKITFIDTPGHQAFTKMRSRGAKIADIAILVVAADDGVQPQTEEAIRIIQEEDMPFVVAINKIDKSNADVERVKAQLAKASVLLEGFGGSVSFQPISAKANQGIEELLDLILLAADVEEFTYDPKASATGFILEAHRDSRVGNIATVIIKNGTLSQGDAIFAGTVGGKVKGLKNFLGKPEKSLSPSSPALILGFDSLPQIGDEFGVGAPATTSESTATQNEAMTGETVNFMLKADVAGSLEALTELVKTLTPPDGKKLHLVGQSVGEVTEGDAKMAASMKASIVAFNTKVSPAAKTVIKNNHLHVFEAKVVYHLIEALADFLKRGGKLPVIGELEILAVFDQKNFLKQIVGGKVIMGVMKNQNDIEIVRGGTEVGFGKLMNLQQLKKEVDEVHAGAECGMLINSKTRIEVGDHFILRALEY